MASPRARDLPGLYRRRQLLMTASHMGCTGIGCFFWSCFVAGLLARSALWSYVLIILKHLLVIVLDISSFFSPWWSDQYCMVAGSLAIAMIILIRNHLLFRYCFFILTSEEIRRPRPLCNISEKAGQKKLQEKLQWRCRLCSNKSRPFWCWTTERFLSGPC